MAKLLGRSVWLYKNGTVIGCCKSAELNVDCDTIEVSGPSTGKWRQYIAGMKSWSVSSSHLMLEGGLKSFALTPGTQVTLKFRDLGNGSMVLLEDYVEGTAICTAAKVTATKGNLVQGSFTWQGTGELAEGGVTPGPTPAPVEEV